MGKSITDERPDKPFHKAECCCAQCEEWEKANPLSPMKASCAVHGLRSNTPDKRSPPPLMYAGPGGAETEQLEAALNLIPYEGLEAVGRIFTEGVKKYGRDKWKGGVWDKVYQEERCSHAIRHLMLWANGDRSEAHLAKVAWFCLTQIWTEAKEKTNV